MAAFFLNPAIVFFFPAAMALAASMDVVTMTIPNRVSAALAIGYLALALALGVPLQSIAIHVSCGAGVLAIAFALFSLGWIGGGDAKLAAATGLWFGWGLMLDYSLSAAIYGGALTVLILLGRASGSAGLPVAPSLDRPPARRQDGGSLRRRARGGWVDALSADRNLARRRKSLRFPSLSEASSNSSGFCNQLDTPD